MKRELEGGIPPEALGRGFVEVSPRTAEKDSPFKDIFLRAKAFPRFLMDRLRKRSDSEHEQAIIRLVIACLVLVYLFFVSARSPLDGVGLGGVPIQAKLLFVLFSLLVLADIVIHPASRPVRRIVGAAGDLGAISYVLSISGKSGLPLTVIYLWVIMGNGFRYGPRYLFGAMGIGVIGLFYVYAKDPFWQTYPNLFWSELLAITLLPLYMVVLLKKMQKLIEQSNEASQAKSRFLANMSHELRTPLNGIIGMSDLLLVSGAKPVERPDLATIRSSAHALLGIVEHILDFSRIEAGKVASESTEFDFQIFLMETLGMLEPLARKKRLGFATWIDSSVPGGLKGDLAHLRQVLVNIVGNAIKFTSEGRVDVKVSSKNDTERRIRIQIDVTDTGIGIPEEVQDRVFESFSQGDESVTKRFGGTGLGMAIAKNLTELMGGRITFESRINVGTTFRLEIPFERASEKEDLDSQVSVRKVLVAASRPTSDQLAILLHDIGVEPVFAGPGTREWEKGSCDVVIAECGLSKEILEDLPGGKDPSWTPSVRLLIDSHGGGCENLKTHYSTGYSVVFRSTPDRTTLLKALRLIRIPSGDLRDPASGESYPGFPSSERGLFVLVAEDNSVNQHVIKGILESGGHQVHLVENGEQALDVLEDDQLTFDLMILDMHMPKIGGLEVLKAYRFMERENPIPSIILTANATMQALTESEEAGAGIYLTKPIEAKRLLASVEKLTRAEPGDPDGGQTMSKPPSSKNQIDVDLLKQLEELTPNPNFLKDLIDHFMRDGEELLDEIEDAAYKGDFLGFQDSVHALKGSAAQVGGVQLVRLCGEAEKLKSSEMDTFGPISLVAKIRRAFLEATHQLERFPRTSLRND